MRNLQICGWQPWHVRAHQLLGGAVTSISLDTEQDLVILSSEAGQIGAVSASTHQVHASDWSRPAMCMTLVTLMTWLLRWGYMSTRMQPCSWPRIAAALIADRSFMLGVQVKCHKQVVPGSFKHVVYLLEQEAICCCCSSGEIILLRSSSLELEEVCSLP